MWCTSGHLCEILNDATHVASDARRARDRRDESWAVLSKWCCGANPTHHGMVLSVRTRGNDTLCQHEPVSAWKHSPRWCIRVSGCVMLQAKHPPGRYTSWCSLSSKCAGGIHALLNSPCDLVHFFQPVAAGKTLPLFLAIASATAFHTKISGVMSN